MINISLEYLSVNRFIKTVFDYYIATNGADLGEAFSFTSDDTGYIGIHETPDYDNLTCKDTVVSGIELFAEKLDGILVGTITAGE